MSSISASGIGQSLMQYLQQLTSDAQSGTTDAATTAAPAATTTSTSDAASAATTTQTTGHHHRHHGGGSKIKEIQDAVTSALQSAQASGSTTDPNKVIQSAIEQILAGANNATPATATGTATASTNEANSPQSQFEQTLQSFGVNPQDFRNDFLTAVKDAQGGQVNAGTAFGSFPPGTQVDTTG